MSDTTVLTAFRFLVRNFDRYLKTTPFNFYTSIIDTGVREIANAMSSNLVKGKDTPEFKGLYDFFGFYLIQDSKSVK